MQSEIIILHYQQLATGLYNIILYLCVLLKLVSLLVEVEGSHQLVFYTLKVTNSIIQQFTMHRTLSKPLGLREAFLIGGIGFVSASLSSR